MAVKSSKADAFGNKTRAKTRPRKRPGRVSKKRKAHSRKQAFFTQGQCR